MQLVDKTISVPELTKMSEKMFNNLVKAVVDIEKEIMAVDAGMHVDQEFFLLEEHESEQENLWGINLHPDKYGTPEFIEYDSMINIRPSQGNRSRGVENADIRKKIELIIKKLVVQ